MGTVSSQLKARQRTKYIKLEEESELSRVKRDSGNSNRSRLTTRKFALPTVPKPFLFDMQEFRLVDDHENVRRVLLRLPEWVAQTPTDGYLEYRYYFPQKDGKLQIDKQSRHLYPAAIARLPWPRFNNASPEVLQAFVRVVNRVAHGRVFSILSVQCRSARNDPLQRKGKGYSYVSRKLSAATNLKRRSSK